jgi:FtsP/CotA-like multicopper oxidase with cupredoxin domain
VVDPYRATSVIDSNPDPDIVETTLTAKEATVDIGGGVMAHVQTFNGTVPGPTFHLKVGDTVIVHLVNDLAEPTGLHWHGIELNNESDGTPLTQNQVPPGGTHLYKFIVSRPGIFWYHPHHHASTNQVFKGMYGAIFVADPYDAPLQASGVLPPAAQTLALAVSDVTVCKAVGSNDQRNYDLSLPWVGAGPLPEQLAPTPFGLCELAPMDESGGARGAPFNAGDIPNIQTSDGRGRTNEGQTVLTNGVNVGGRAGSPEAPGALAPGAYSYDVQAGQGLRLQLGNAATIRFDRFKLTDGTGAQIPLIRVGGEGGLLDHGILEGAVAGGYDPGYSSGEILLDPGSRADVVAALPIGLAVGSDLTLWTEDYVRTGLGFSNIATVPVAHFHVAGTASVAYAIADHTPLREVFGKSAEVEELGEPTAHLLDPTKLDPAKPGMSSEDIKLTNKASTLGIDDVQGSHDAPDYKTAPQMASARYARIGDVLELTVTNTTGASHPFHLHGFSMQPISLTGGFGTDYIWGYNEYRDNIDIPKLKTLKFRIRLDDRPLPDGGTPGGGLGRWLFHCHIFFHATNGMIGELDVLPKKANEGYDYKTIAATSGAVGGFTTLGIGPSINDWGEVAFMGGTSNGGTGLYLADATGAKRAVNPGWSSNISRRFDDFLEVNNSDVIAVGDRVSGAPPSYRVRLWDARPGIIDTYETLDTSGSGSSTAASITFDPGYFGLPSAGIAGMMDARSPGFELVPGTTTPGRGYESVIVPTMNDKGAVGWLGLGGGDWAFANNRGGTSDSWAGSLRQVITGDDHIVARAGGDVPLKDVPPGTANAPLKMWDTSFGSEETIACQSGCAHPGFGFIGRFAGASDDTAVIAFVATGPQGTGVYASVRATIGSATTADGRVIVPIAMTGPGTLKRIQATYRVAVNSTQKSGERAVEIAFMADSVTGYKGLWVSRLRFKGNADGTYDSEHPTALTAEPAVMVVQQATSIPGLPGSVKDIWYYDPLNNRSIGDLAFWVSLSDGSQAIVRARPKCPAADYALGSEVDSQYINQYDAGAKHHLPRAYGVRGGNACGPAAYSMAFNTIQHARGKATRQGKMANLRTVYGDGTTNDTGAPSGVMRRDDGQNIAIEDDDHASFDRSRAEAILASQGWTYEETQGKAGLNDALDAGMQVLQSTSFGAAPQSYNTAGGMGGNFGAGNVILFSGRTPNGDYIVQDAAGDYFSDPLHPSHYGAGKCGNYTVYEKRTVEMNLTYHAGGSANVPRYGLALGYHQNADPDVLLVQAFPNGATTDRSFDVWVTDSAGRKAGFPNGDASAVSAIPESSASIDAISVSAPDAGPEEDIAPSTFPYAVLIVNPPADLQVHVSGRTSDASYRLEYTHFNGGEQTSSDLVAGTVAAGESKTVRVTKAPNATPQSVKVVQDTARSITLAGTDKDADSLTFAVASQPSHGTLSAVDASGKVVYTPAAGYLGADSFTFTADDGVAVSKAATVTITVKTNDPPTVAIASHGSSTEGVALALSAVASEPDQEALTYAWTATGGAQVSPAGDGSTASFTNVEGPTDETVTVTATDPHGATATASSAVHVDNTAPAATFAPGTSNEGSPFTLNVNGVTDLSPADVAAGFEYAFDCGGGYAAFSRTSSALCGTTDSGTVSVGAKVRDRDAGVREYRNNVVVKNLPPVMSAGSAQTQFWGLPVSLVGSATDPSSVDQASGFVTSWTFGDGQSASGAGAVHAYAKPGSYSAKFAATDKDGATGSANVAVTIGKRGGSLASAAAVSAPYGFLTLQARLADSVDRASAVLSGHSVLFLLGTQSFVAQTDASGLATVTSSSVAPGAYQLAVSLVNNLYYNAAAVRANVTVTRSIGRVTGTTLAFATGGTGSLSITSTATGVTGTLSYASSSPSLNATQLGPLGIRADGQAAWLNGVDSAGRKLVVYAEDNGAGDVFKLWINGALVTGTGALASGDVAITPG